MRPERKKLHCKVPRAASRRIAIKRKVFKTNKQRLVCLITKNSFFMLTNLSFNDTDRKRISFLIPAFFHVLWQKENNFNSFIHR